MPDEDCNQHNYKDVEKGDEDHAYAISMTQAGRVVRVHGGDEDGAEHEQPAEEGDSG